MDKTTEWLQTFKLIDEPVVAPIPEKKRAKTLSIASGKGGVGKTTVALKMALELAGRGYKTLLVDCDFNLSNTAIKLGIPLSSNFLDYISMKRSFENCLHKQGNFHLLAGCNGDLEIFDGHICIDTIVVELVKDQEQNYDLIILDCPAGLSKRTLNLNAYCDHRIFVVNPDRSSLTDSYSLIKVLKRKYGISENYLIVNKLESTKQYYTVVKSLSETVESFLNCRTKVLGGISREEIPSVDFDKKFVCGENSASHKNFLKIVSKLTESFGGSPRFVENMQYII